MVSVEMHLIARRLWLSPLFLTGIASMNVSGRKGDILESDIGNYVPKARSPWSMLDLPSKSSLDTQ